MWSNSHTHIYYISQNVYIVIEGLYIVPLELEGAKLPLCKVTV